MVVMYLPLTDTLTQCLPCISYFSDGSPSGQVTSSHTLSCLHTVERLGAPARTRAFPRELPSNPRDEATLRHTSTSQPTAGRIYLCTRRGIQIVGPWHQIPSMMHYLKLPCQCLFLAWVRLYAALLRARGAACIDFLGELGLFSATFCFSHGFMFQIRIIHGLSGINGTAGVTSQYCSLHSF